MRAFHENPDRTYTLNSHIIKSCMLFSSAEIFEASLTNSVDPDQPAVGAVWSGSTLFAFILMLINKQTFSDVIIILVAFQGFNHVNLCVVFS